MATPTQPRVSTACDPCRRRKVRCNGLQRCQQCEHFDLRCTYTHTPRSRSRKNAARRGGVISEYKKSVAKCAAGGAGVGLRRLALAPASELQSRVTEAEAEAATTTSLTASYFLNLIPEYLSCVYPFSPVITEDEVRDSIRRMDSERTHAAFVYAFAAVTIDLTRSDVVQSAPDTPDQITDLLHRSIEAQQPLILGEHASVLRAMTSLFCEICFMGLSQHDLGLYYLRDAISMVHMLRIEDPAALAKLDVTEHARRRRLYWQCFIHERFMAIARFTPAMMSPHPQSAVDDDPTLPPGISQGWTQLIRTFLPLDATFLDLWIDDRSRVTPEWIEQKHHELDDARWELEVSMLSELQQADLVITRQWLRTLLWQLAMSNCLLSSTTSRPSLSLSLPLRLSGEIRQFLTTISQDVIRIHGSGILNKLLEIINTIADVVIHMPQATDEATTARIGDIVFLRNVIFSFPRIGTVSQRILTEKFDLIRKRFPCIQVALLL